MAKIEFPGIGEYQKLLASLGASAEGVCKYAIYDAAGVVIDEIKARTPVDEESKSGSGDLRDSWCLTHMQNNEGFVYTKVDCPGYDRKGVPNRIKARVLTSGRSDQSGRKKNPFVRQAVNAVKSKAISLIEFNLDKKINEIMNNK